MEMPGEGKATPKEKQQRRKREKLSILFRIEEENCESEEAN
jgi:hypothetical protein